MMELADKLDFASVTLVTELGVFMGIIGDIFLEIVGGIAELIGKTLAVKVDDSLSPKHSIKRIAITIIAGLLTLAVIIALGFAALFLFATSHPVAGFFVAVIVFFLLVLFISVIIKLYQIKRKK